MKYINRVKGIELEMSIDELLELEDIATRNEGVRGSTSRVDKLSEIAGNIIEILKTIKN